jgi:hypothetical protein
MVLSPQQTINHTPPPSQHVQHLQPTHTPLPIVVGTLQHPHPKAVSTVTTYIRKFGQMNPLQAQALPACLLPLSFSLGTCVCMPLRGALQRPPARWRPLGEPRRVRRVRPRGRRTQVPVAAIEGSCGWHAPRCHFLAVNSDAAIEPGDGRRERAAACATEHGLLEHVRWRTDEHGLRRRRREQRLHGGEAAHCAREERPTSGERPSEQEERAVPTQFAPAGTAPSRSKLSLFLFLFAKHPRYAVTAGAYRLSYFLPSG